MLSFQDKIRPVSTTTSTTTGLSFADKIKPVVKTPTLENTNIAPEVDTYGAFFPASPTDTPFEAGLKATGNLPSSAYGLVKSAATAILHPIDTLGGISRTLMGGVEKLVGSDMGNIKTFDAFTQTLKNRYGSLENLQRTATNDPFGFGTDLVSLFSGGAGLIGKGTQAEQLISKTGQLVTKPTATLVGKTGQGISSTAKFVTSQATGLNPETITQLVKSPEKFKVPISRSEITDSVKNALDTRLEELSDLGKEYQVLRESNQVVTIPQDTIPKVLNKYGVKLDTNNRIVTSAESRPLSLGDKNALQEFIDNYGNQRVLSSNGFLNTREALSNLAKYDASKTNISTNISRDLRATYDAIGKKQIKGLEVLDTQYAPERQLLGQLKKDIFTPQGELKDGAISKIANITGKGKENLLNRMKEIVPDIEQRVKVLKAVEDIEKTSGIKVGTYARAIGLGAGGFGVATGNIPVIIGAILAQPEIAVPLLKGYGYVGQKASPILNTLKVIANDINRFKLPSPILNQIEKTSKNFNAGLSIKAQVDLPKNFNAQNVAKLMDKTDDIILKNYIANPNDSDNFLKMTKLANDMGIDALNIKIDQLESFMREVAKERGLLPTKLTVNSASNSLLQEAKKYKTAEEFVKAKPIKRKVIGYRYGSKEGQVGAGTFYNLESGVDKVPEGQIYKFPNEIKKSLEFRNPLILKDSEILVGGEFEYSPADFLARKWGLPEKGVEAEINVAKEAVKKGYDAVIYGNNEIQDLTNLYKSQLTDIWNKANKR